jgi:hypothetical protein
MEPTWIIAASQAGGGCGTFTITGSSI